MNETMKLLSVIITLSNKYSLLNRLLYKQVFVIIFYIKKCKKFISQITCLLSGARPQAQVFSWACWEGPKTPNFPPEKNYFSENSCFFVKIYKVITYKYNFIKFIHVITLSWWCVVNYIINHNVDTCINHTSSLMHVCIYMHWLHTSLININDVCWCMFCFHCIHVITYKVIHSTCMYVCIIHTYMYQCITLCIHVCRLIP
jgi:hypothetical protein